MKQSLIIRSALLAAAFGFTTAALRADIVTLKNGEKIEGKILEKTADSIRIEYHLTPKIKDTKTIPTANIESIKVQTPSEVEFEERGLRKLLPTPDLMTAGEYEAIIQDKLRTFTGKYPGTPETAEVEKIIEELSKEKARVSAGELKVEGKWLDVAAVKRDTYNIEAYRLRMEMKEKAAEIKDDRYINALREFEKLREQYPASLQYVEAIPEAVQIMNTYEKQLTVMITEQPVLAEKRAAGLRSLQGNDLQITKASVDQEERSYKARYDEQVKSKLKWRDIYKYDKKGLMDAQTTLLASLQELQGIDLAALKKENETYLAIIRFMADGNVAEAESSIDRLSKSSQSTANKSSSAIISDLRRRFAAAKKADIERRKAEAKAAAMQPNAAIVAQGDKDGANPLEEALKKQEELMKAKDKSGKAGSPKANAGKSGDKGKAAKGKDDDKEGKDGEKSAKAAVSEPEPEPTMMEKLTDYAPIIGGGVLLVLVVTLLMGKKKDKEE